MVAKVAEELRGYAEWSEPRDGAGAGPFRLACKLEPAASTDEIEAAWSIQELPSELLELWRTTKQARLFEDIDYGQWGLCLLSPSASAERTILERGQRSADFLPGDVVVGEFLGDQELLVLAPSEIVDRRVLIALPLDSRSEWYAAADGLAVFLRKYLENMGDKFWEQASRC